MNARTVDVAVIGAGIMGASAAWQLARQGMRVALFERFELGHVRGSSHGASRIFRLAYEVEDYVRLGQQALPIWREAEAALGTELLRTTGGLDFGPPENLEPFAHALSAAGSRFEPLSASQLTQRFPAYRLPPGWEGIYQPDAGILAADTCRLGFVQLARDAGAQVLAATPVTRLTRHGDSVTLDTAQGHYHAEQVVVAAAGWTNRLLEPFGLSVPLKVTREQVAYFPHAESDSFLPFICHASKVTFDIYGLPNWTRPEIKVAQHGTGPEVDPDSQGSVDQARLEPVRRFVRDHLPSISPDPIRSEPCLYATTPDDDFVIDRIGPIVLGTGFGGHGFKFGSVVGAVLADLVQGKEIPFRSRFSYARFATLVTKQG